MNKDLRIEHLEDEVRSLKAQLAEKERQIDALNYMPDAEEASFSTVQNTEKIDYEFLVRKRTDELTIINEELIASNEELYVINEELHEKGILIEKEMNARLEATKMLEESENKMRNFITQSSQGILIIDDVGRLIEWNPAMENMTGISNEDAVGELCWNVFQKSMPKENAVELSKNYRGKVMLYTANFKKAAEESTHIMYHTDGTKRYVVINFFQIEMPNCNYVGQIVSDVTAQKMLDYELEKHRLHLEHIVELRTKELVRAKEKAVEADNLKSAFLANMSHEIRTPLNGIIGFLQHIKKENLTPERREKFTNVIENNCLQLARLIDDIIDISKIEAKQLTIHAVPVHLNNIMHETRIFFQTYLANNKKNIELILDECGFIEDCIIYVDVVRLRQVLNNLISNAIKFTDKGFVRFGYRQSAADLLEFVVEDSGIGISDDQKNVVFERFSQADIGYQRVQYGGTGLGLTISRSLAQMKGGDIWVESVVGSGSSFFFTISYLPIAPADLHIFDDTPAERDNPFVGKSALLFEPIPARYKYFEKLISTTGASVTHASTMHDLISQTKSIDNFDLVIADASIVEKDEYNTLKQIIKTPKVLIGSQKVAPCNTKTYMEMPVDYGKLVGVMREIVEQVEKQQQSLEK